MLVTTPQMTNYHSLRTPGTINISLNNNKNLEMLETYKLLGVQFGNTLRWEKHVSSCCASLAILRKLRNMAPFQIGKQLAESQILSKLDYCDVVYYDLPTKLLKRLQRVQSSAACFITGKFSREEDVLNWVGFQ